jgi:hypothetical protein
MRFAPAEKMLEALEEPCVEAMDSRWAWLMRGSDMDDMVDMRCCEGCIELRLISIQLSAACNQYSLVQHTMLPVNLQPAIDIAKRVLLHDMEAFGNVLRNYHLRRH